MTKTMLQKSEEIRSAGTRLAQGKKVAEGSRVDLENWAKAMNYVLDYNGSGGLINVKSVGDLRTIIGKVSSYQTSQGPLTKWTYYYQELTKPIHLAGRPFDGELQPQPNELPGGLGDGLTPADVDPIEFDIGMEMEKEHTPDEATRQEIVLDHLAEDPTYYSKLKQMAGEGVDVQMFGEMRATKL